MNNSLLKNQLNDLAISLNENQINQFQQYYQIMVEWNEVMNLTAITEYEEVVIKHFADSLSLIKIIDLKEPVNIIDIGTGAGFPGIPLKIAFPHLNVTLLDSLNKRIKFLDQVIEILGLTNIKTLHGRAEDYAKKPGYRETYDLCVSRAVANLSTLSEYCMPYIRVGGTFISYKSGEIEEELTQSQKAIQVLGGTLNKTEKFTLTGTDITRSLIKITKIAKTPSKYPRKAGTPTKEPL